MLANEKNESATNALSAWILMRAGENHIGIAPDRFLHFPGQAELHMYSCDL